VRWNVLSCSAPGQFVWHRHIVEHEDNEMMRPYRIGPEQPGQPDQTATGGHVRPRPSRPIIEID
jgi:hypothetical protein